MHSILIYPYSDMFFQVLDNLTEKFQNIYLCKPYSWKCYRTIDKVGCFIASDFFECFGLCQQIIIADVIDRNIIYEDIKKKIEIALDNDKKIYCCFKLKSEDIELFVNKGKERFVYLANDRYCVELDIQPSLFYSNAIVVGIGNLLTGQDQSVIAVNIAHDMASKGYSVLHISSNINTVFGGAIKFPTYIFENICHDVDKIYLFNKFIEQVEMEHRPDVIILEIPYGMLKYSNSLHNGFGIVPFLISQAISFDYFVLNSPLSIGNAAFYETMSSGFLGRFGCNIDLVSIENVQMDPISEEREELHLFHTDSIDVNNYIDFLLSSYWDNLEKTIEYCPFDLCEFSASDSIISKLSSNVDSM